MADQPGGERADHSSRAIARSVGNASLYSPSVATAGDVVASFGASTAGPAPSAKNPPTMLALGDSIVWGQGLAPEHRFRELVRQRLEQEGEPVIELAMARSGAHVDPSPDAAFATYDADVGATVLNPPIHPSYAPGYAHETISGVLTTVQQSRTARELLAAVAADAPAKVRWALLDGGINDTGIGGIITPFPAYDAGYFLDGWTAWLIDQTRDSVGQLETTIKETLQSFPNAVVVVNGYYPLFSYYSALTAARLQGFGALYVTTTSILATGVAFEAVVAASYAWQKASNHFIRRAVKNAKNAFPGRVVLFARSNIEGNKCLFGGETWLWGYRGSFDNVSPSNVGWDQWALGAIPEDEVWSLRYPFCDTLAAAGQARVVCHLASIGHPNVNGALDYADSIIIELEDAGVISSALSECDRSSRRRRRGCRDFNDSFGYKCIDAEAAIGTGCSGVVRTLGGAAKRSFDTAKDLMRTAGRQFTDADACVQGAGAVNDFARNRLRDAATHLGRAADHLGAIDDCWQQVNQQLQACNNNAVAAEAQCNRTRDAANRNCDGIQCTDFTNCNRFRSWDPRRYTCRAARALCVGAAAIRRGACSVAAAAEFGICWAAAEVQRGLCDIGQIAANLACSAAETGQAAADVAIGMAEGGVGVAAGVIGSATRLGCFGADLAKAGGLVGLAAAAAGTGIIAGVLTGMVGLTCAFVQWMENRLCRFGAWVATGFCHLGAFFADAGCRIASVFA